MFICCLFKYIHYDLVIYSWYCWIPVLWTHIFIFSQLIFCLGIASKFVLYLWFLMVSRIDVLVLDTYCCIFNVICIRLRTLSFALICFEKIFMCSYNSTLFIISQEMPLNDSVPNIFIRDNWLLMTIPYIRPLVNGYCIFSHWFRLKTTITAEYINFGTHSNGKSLLPYFLGNCAF